MPKTPPPPPLPGPEPAPAALQAQLLATEHWSLLASRTTTQNEVLTRISMLLTFVSAVLVSLALVGQATRFGPDFPAFAIALLSLALVVGTLTQVRVFNTAAEDLMYVLAMNRLRAAYAELAPGVEKWFMASRHDDQAGSVRTYYFFGDRSGSVVLGSSMMFIGVVNATLLGLLAATVALVLGAVLAAAIGIALVLGAAFLGVGTLLGYRIYRQTWRVHAPLAPTPGSAATPGSAS